MSNQTLIQSAEISDSAQGKAASFVPTNIRVTSGEMPLSVQTDVPIFPGSSPALTVTATWLVAGTKVTANGVGLINSGSVSMGYNPVPAPTGALQILPGNQNVLIKF